MRTLALIALLIGCDQVVATTHQQLTTGGETLFVQRIGSSNEYEFLIHQDRITYHVTNSITRDVIVLRGISVDGRQVVFGGGAGYAIEISTAFDMNDRFWSGGEPGHFEGDFESDPMALSILADNELVHLLPGENVHVSSFQITQATVTYSKHPTEGAVLAFERVMLWNGLNMRHEVKRQTLQDICIWTEYVSAITTRGPSHPNAVWPIHTVWTNALAIFKDDFDVITGETGNYTMDNLGERFGVPSSNYMWFYDGDAFKMLADGLDITVQNDSVQKVAVFDKAGNAGGFVQAYHVSHEGPPEFVPKRTVDTWGHTIYVDPL
jgi:hypothetical protein